MRTFLEVIGWMFVPYVMIMVLICDELDRIK